MELVKNLWEKELIIRDINHGTRMKPCVLMVYMYVFVN